MKSKAATAERTQVVPHASGVVLEVGVGSGLNLPLYSPRVRRLYALDPSPTLLRMARRRAARVALPVTWLEGSAEAIPLEDRVADTVVTTWTLCTIRDPVRALREMRRVLKRDGRVLFVEHGHSPDPNVAVWQARLTPLWRRIAGGCHLDRQIDALFVEARLEVQQLSAGYGVGPRPFAYLYRGAACRVDAARPTVGVGSHERVKPSPLRPDAARPARAVQGRGTGRSHGLPGLAHATPAPPLWRPAAGHRDCGGPGRRAGPPCPLRRGALPGGPRPRPTRPGRDRLACGSARPERGAPRTGTRLRLAARSLTGPPTPAQDRGGEPALGVALGAPRGLGPAAGEAGGGRTSAPPAEVR